MQDPTPTRAARITPGGHRSAWAVLAAGTLCVGVPFWTIPYRQVNLPDALLGPGLVVVAVGALLLCALRLAPFGRALLAAGAAVPAAVFLRIVVEVLRDPTSHNLWPFEMIIAVFVGATAAAAGAVPGWVIARLRSRPPRDPR